MNDREIYIWHQQDRNLVTKFTEALAEPDGNPILFNIWGDAGVGKTTLIDWLEVNYERQAYFIIYTFNLIEDIKTPLDIMFKISNEANKQLSTYSNSHENLSDRRGSFTRIYQEYQQTLFYLKNQPLADKTTIDSTQIKLLDSLSYTLLPTVLKTELQELLHKHPATRHQKNMQELLLSFLPKITELFIEELLQKSHIPMVIVLDNYEQAPAEIDLWLREYLLRNNNLKQHKLRLLLAGRRSLLKEAAWHKLQQDQDLIYEQHRDEFSKEQTRIYLQSAGLIQSLELQQIYRVTKGLPYYLNWFISEQNNNPNIGILAGNQTMLNILLQKFNSRQKQVLQLAACCRWFNRALIRNLVVSQGLDFETAVDKSLDAFDWLTQSSFVELIEGYYRLNDVVREALRLSLWQNEQEQFYQINNWLANYFESMADREVPADFHITAQYENPDWCRYRSEYLYYIIFARISNDKTIFISDLFAGIYLNRHQVVKVAYLAINSEVKDIEYHPLLSYETQKFMVTIRPAIEYSWLVIEAKAIDEKTLEICGFQPSQIEVTLQNCDFYMTSLNGVAKFAALLFKSRRCLPKEQINWLRLAFQTAAEIVTSAAPEFSSNLFKGELATGFYNLGFYEVAIACYERSLAFKPESAVIWCRRGIVLSKLRRYEQAIASYNQALKLHSADSETWYNRGIALRYLKLYEEAIASYQKALELEPERWEIWNSCGITLRKLGRLKEAIATYNKALEFKPDDPGIWYNRGIALDELGDYQAALLSYSKTLELKPDDYETWYNQGITLRKLGRYEEALVSYNRALEFHIADASTWYNRGYVLDELQRYEEAIASYDKALELEPDDFSTWYNRALALRKLGRIEEAIASFNKAIELEPKKHKAWFNRGLALRQLGLLENAIASFDKALKLQSNDPSTWYNKACCYGLQGNVNLAVESLKQAINLSPDRCRQMAINDPDFDAIRWHQAFKNCLNQN